MAAKTIEQLETEERAAEAALVTAREAFTQNRPADDGSALDAAYAKSRAARTALTRARHAADPAFAPRDKLLQAVTEFGTFERRTPRSYTHVVLYQRNADQLAAESCETIANLEVHLASVRSNPRNAIYAKRLEKQIEGYRQVLADPTKWICYRWSQTFRAACAGKRELLKWTNVKIERAVVCEVVTGKVVA